MNNKTYLTLGILLIILIFGGIFISKKNKTEDKSITNSPSQTSEKALFYEVQASSGLTFEVRINDIPIAEDVASSGNLINVVHPGKNVVSVLISRKNSSDISPRFELSIHERTVGKDSLNQSINKQEGDVTLVSYAWNPSQDKLPITFTKEFQSKVGIAKFLSDNGETVGLTPQTKKEILAEANTIYQAFIKKNIPVVIEKMTPLYMETELFFPNDQETKLKSSLKTLTEGIEKGKFIFKSVSNNPDDYIYTLYGNRKIIRIQKKSGESFLQTPSEEGISRGFELSFSKIDGKWIWVR